MKKLLLIISTIISVAGHTQDLNGVTFGFAAGYRLLQHDMYDYSLTTDVAHNLQRQTLSRGSVVISSAISVRLNKLTVTNGVLSLRKLDNAGKRVASPPKAKPWQRLSLNASLNLAEIQSSGVAFNKNIDGGVGLGFLLTDNVQLSAFYDIQSVRQLRDYIVDSYLGKPIPNGTSVYNALDTGDNNLFYNKAIGGFSFKIIYAIGNKKPSGS